MGRRGTSGIVLLAFMIILVAGGLLYAALQPGPSSPASTGTLTGPSSYAGSTTLPLRTSYSATSATTTTFAPVVVTINVASSFSKEARGGALVYASPSKYVTNYYVQVADKNGNVVFFLSLSGPVTEYFTASQTGYTNATVSIQLAPTSGSQSDTIYLHCISFNYVC